MQEGRNPRDIKMELASELVRRFHSAEAADKAAQSFVARFRKGQLPEDIPEITLPAGDGGLMIGNLLKEAGLVSSTSEAMRMIKQGAVKVDGERVEDTRLFIKSGATVVYQVGKRRFARVTVE